MKFLPDQLKKLRESKGYSLGTTARLLGARCGCKVSRSAICHWEKGTFMPSVKSLMALAELYGVGMNAFFASREKDVFSISSAAAYQPKDAVTGTNHEAR